MKIEYTEQRNIFFKVLKHFAMYGQMHESEIGNNFYIYMYKIMLNIVIYSQAGWYLAWQPIAVGV